MHPLHCLLTYFAAIFVYCKNVWLLARDNDYLVSSTALLVTAGLGSVGALLDKEYFGISNHLLLLVLGTVFFNTYYGIKKSKRQSLEAVAKAQELPQGSPEYNMQIKISKLKKFDPKKLQFVFFKAFTLMGYLYFVQQLLKGETDNAPLVIQALDFTTEILVKVPVAIFWYYEFKSIGENSAYTMGKKAGIFTIVEWIFEPRIKKFRNPNNEQ